MLKRLNIKHYGFHSLRHTFATRLLENGVNIKTISELIGHFSPTITLNRYVHTNMQNKLKAMQKISKNRPWVGRQTTHLSTFLNENLEEEPTDEEINRMIKELKRKEKDFEM